MRWRRVESTTSYSTPHTGCVMLLSRLRLPHYFRIRSVRQMANADHDKLGHHEASGLALETVRRHSDADAPLTLYCGWFCPFAQRAWIALEEKKSHYRYVEVNPYKKEAHFMAVNPRGLVPAIEHKGSALYESLVLLEFLDDLEPQSSLRSTESPIETGFERLAIEELQKRIVPAFYKLLQASEPSNQPEAKEALVKALNDWASRFFVGPWIRGQRFGAADVALAPWAARMWLLEEERQFDWSRIDSNLSKWFKDVLERDSVKKTTSERANLRKAYDRYLTNTAQSEVGKATRAGTDLP